MADLQQSLTTANTLMYRVLSGAKVDTAIQQSTKGQDFYWTAHTEQGDLLILCDGHGSDIVIDIIRSFDFTPYTTNIENIDPSSIINHLQKFTNTELSKGSIINKASGSTITVIVINKTSIRMAWLGDSQAIVFKDGAMVFKTRSHNIIEDSDSIGFRKKHHSWGSEINTNGQMVQKYKPYIKHSDHDLCALTRALGHGGLAFNTPETVTIEIDTISNWKIVGGSDGMHDVIGEGEKDLLLLHTSSASQLCDIAVERWSPDHIWEFIPLNAPIFNTSFQEKDIDDIVIVTWEKKGK